MAFLAGQSKPDRPPPDYFVDSQLLLAEILADSGERTEAVALYRSLVGAVDMESTDFDRTTSRIFLGGLRTYAAIGNFDKAGAAADALIARGPDSPTVNRALIGFAGLLDRERKKNGRRART